MTPELLQALTSAKGVPMVRDDGHSVDKLAQLFQRERRLRELARRLSGSREVSDGQIRAMAMYFGCPATGKNSHTIRPAAWSHAECAQACQGLDERYFQALRYTYALDDSVFHTLSLSLWEWGLKRREIERWPQRVVTLGGVEARYLRDLVDMWMLEVRAPWRFKRETNDPKADLRRTIMNVSEQVWRRRLSPIYEAIRQEFDVWLAIGIGHMARRLREEAAA